MFSVKFLKDKNTAGIEFEKTTKNIISYILDKLNFKDSNILSDNSSIEIVTGKESLLKKDGVTIELLIRKNIVINQDDFRNKEKLDEYITKIKHFCDQAKTIEDLKYLPIELR